MTVDILIKIEKGCLTVSRVDSSTKITLLGDGATDTFKLFDISPSMAVLGVTKTIEEPKWDEFLKYVY
jgi:hypothetical protein